MLSLVVTNQVGKWQTNDKVSNKENWEVRFQYVLGPINLRSSIKASILTVSTFFLVKAGRSDHRYCQKQAL